jgi:glycosyltransferase involved in cell wall biosynthesis
MAYFQANGGNKGAQTTPGIDFPRFLATRWTQVFMPTRVEGTTLRVVEITHGLGVGGAEISLWRRLSSTDGAETTVINTLPRLATLEHDFRKCGIKVLSVAIFRPSGLVRLAKILRDLKPNCVVAHSPTSAAAVLLLRAIGILRSPVVVVAHNTSYRKIFRVIMPVFNRFAVAHIGVSKAVMAGEQCKGARTRRLLYLGGGTASIYAPRDPRTGPPVFLALGRLARQKRIDLLLQAVYMAREPMRKAAAKALIVGDGPLRHTLESMVAEMDIGDLVRFCGLVLPSEPILHDVDVLLISSDYEGLPLALYEAMQAGLLIVARAVGGIPEVVDPGAGHILLTSARPDDMAGGIISCIDRMNSIRAGRLHRSAVADRWSGEQASISFYETLNSVLGDVPS